MLLVFTIGLLNLGLGFVLALLFERSGKTAWRPAIDYSALRRRFHWPRRKATQPPSADAEVAVPVEPGRSAPPPEHTRTTERHKPPSETVSAERKPSGIALDAIADESDGILDRKAFDALVQNWVTRDADRVRMVSGILVKMDPYHESAELGPHKSDEYLAAAFAGLLESLVRKKRGFDRVAQLSEDVYLLFLGDTALRSAIMAAERFRQTIASSVFKRGERSVCVTASCAVAEWGTTESPDQWTDRLHRLLQEAIGSGGNRGYVEDENGVRPIAPSQSPVPKREICVAVE